MSHPSDTDIVTLSAVHLATTIGPDHWNRIRPQPIALSLHLHLAPSYLDIPGQSDNVTDSLHYGHLAKVVENRVGAKGERTYASARDLLDDMTDAAFRFAMDATAKGDSNVGEVVHAVRVVVQLPKQILLAAGFSVELTTRASDWLGKHLETGSSAPAAVVRVTDLTLAVLIGVNPPERLAKQRVVTHLTFFEAARIVGAKEIDYPAIVQQVATVRRAPDN